MTKPEADARCVELNRRSSGDEHWFARKAGDNEDWTVVQMSGMPARRRGRLKADVETPPRPGAPPDPRPSLIRNIPPYGPS
ncbi:MAG: hypothetical protein M3022_13490 [Actinomycetota bacterium]|nr:hypothetical protein [Actinomycetota bacterium]